MPVSKALKTAATIGFLFFALVAVILFMLIKRVISVEMAMLMFVGMLGLYVGFGVLVAVYRFIGRLK